MACFPEPWELDCGPHELPAAREPDPDPEPQDGPWHDHLDEITADACAIVEAVHADDVQGLAVLLKHADATRLRAVCLTFGKLMTEGVHREDIESGFLRRWAAHAVRHP